MKSETTVYGRIVKKYEIPLDQIDFRNQQKVYQGSLFDDECEGYCGI